MPEVHFYHNVPDTLAATWQLTARAYRGGRKVAILAPDVAAAARLDEGLWIRDPQAFLPHVAVDAPLAGETPILIGSADQPRAWAHHDILLNVGAPLPEEYADFQLVLEIVGASEAERAPARQRWMEYRARGVTPHGHDMVRE